MRTLAAAMLVAIASLFGLSACAEEAGSPSADVSTLTLETSSGSHVFAVELADTDETRQRGLMFRDHLAADAGMLFDFETPRIINMWMRNTPLPLDMIFISTAGRVAHIAENTVPFSEAIISSRYEVLSVLEVNAGTARRIGLRTGDQVAHPIFNRASIGQSN